MPANFEPVFAALKAILEKYAAKMSVKADTSTEFTLLTKRPSPFPQHKGQGMYFASVRLGKAYVSYHLMPLYMNPGLSQAVSPELKKRMQGKTCFNFKAGPDSAEVAELRRLTAAGYQQWSKQNWL